MSSESLKSLIVTDPDIVDEGIDISGLRTQTDTNPRLLASIADFPGISYDPTSFDYLSDLNELFAYGLPTTETDQAQIPGAIDTLVDTGGGGQATLPGFEDTTPEPINTPEDQRLIDEGIGLQIAPGQPVFAPGEMPVTQEEIDAFNAPATLDSTSTADEIMQDLLNQQAMLNPTGGNIMDEVALTGITPIEPGTFTADTLDQSFLSEEGLTENQNNTIKNILTAAGQTVEGALTELGKVPGAIVDIANQTVDVFGKKLNVGKTLAGLAINRIVGGPVSLVFDALQSLPKSKSQLQYEGFNDDQRAAIDQAYGPGGVMEGYNPVSAFGDGPLVTIQERIDNRYANVSDPANDPTIKELERLRDTLGGIEAVNAVKTGAPQEDIGAIPGDTGADPTTGDLPGGGNIYDEFAPSDNKDDSPTSNTPSVNEADVEAGLGTESISDFVDDFEVSGEAAPITGVSGADSFFDAVDTATGGGGDRDDDSGPSAPTGPPSGGFQSESTYDAEEEDETADDRGGGGGGGGGGCFLKDTPITMADGSTKEVQKVDLGDNVAEGGKVFATGKFLVENLHDYKGIKVSGSHMVSEEGNWVRVEDSKHGKPLGDEEHTVYVFGSENRRILINGILFTDYFETTEQQKLINNEKDFFNNWKTYENKIDQDNINILNAS